MIILMQSLFLSSDSMTKIVYLCHTKRDDLKNDRRMQYGAIRQKNY